MDKILLNIIDPSNAAMELIKNYNNQWKESFKWLNEFCEEMKFKLINNEKFLLPTTPVKKTRKRKKSKTSPVNKECNSSSNLKLSDGSKENLNDSSLGIRKSKRIALKGITNQHKNSDYIYANIRLKKVCENNQQNDEKDAHMNDRNTQMNIKVSILSEGKINLNETNVLESVSKHSQLENKKVLKNEEITVNKENKLTETPLKYKNTNLTTPSVKHRIQTYEEHIRTMNTPKSSVKSARKSGTLRRSSCCKLFKRSRSIFKAKHSLAKRGKSKSSSISKNECKKILSTNIENCNSINSKNLMQEELKQRRPTLILKRLEDFSPKELKIASSGSKDGNNNNNTHLGKHESQLNSVQSTPVLDRSKMTQLQKSERFQTQLEKTGLSTGIKSTPRISSISTSKLLKNPIHHTSKVSSGLVKQTPQASLSCTSHRSLISRVMSLKQQMTPNVKDKICQDVMKKQQKKRKKSC